MTKLLDNQFCCIRVNRLVLRYHHAHLHQGFNNIADPFGHPVCQLGYDNGLWQLDIADNLFALHILAQGLEACALLLALHRGHGFLSAAFATRERLVQR